MLLIKEKRNGGWIIMIDGKVLFIFHVPKLLAVTEQFNFLSTTFYNDERYIYFVSFVQWNP